jgi:hypothetical protein
MVKGLTFFAKMDARGKIQIPKREYEARGWTTGMVISVRVVPKSPNQIYTGIKEEVMKRDSFTCQKCGSNEKLRVHHNIPRIYGGSDDMDNLTTLCTKCHRKAHVATGQSGMTGKSNIGRMTKEEREKGRLKGIENI